jgi:hypothetical protein
MEELAMANVELLSPVPPIAERTMAVVSPLPTLSGKRIGFRIEWENFDTFCDHLWQRLEADHGAAARVDWHTSFARAGGEAEQQRAAELEWFAAGTDAAVVGLAA